MSIRLSIALFLFSLLLLSSCRQQGKRKGASEIAAGLTPRKLPKNIKLGMQLEEKEMLVGIPMASTPLGGRELPPSVDLSPDMPEVGDQGEQNSCVGWVAYALKSYQEKRELGRQIKFSPAFVYNQINGGENEPTVLTDALNVLSQQGISYLEEMPYNENDWKTKPTKEALANAKRFRIDYWRQVNVKDIKEVKAQLAAGLPIIIGADVSYEFVTEGLAGQDFVWNKRGFSAGGHAMLIVGYDDRRRAFRLMNSWGKSWGDSGYAWIDYKLFPKVVWYGFVAKDAQTAPEAIADYHEEENTFAETGNATEDEVILSFDDVADEDVISFYHDEIDEDAQVSGKGHLGKAISVEGRVNIPKGTGKKFKVAAFVYSAATGKPVKTLLTPDYTDPLGNVSVTTPVYDVDTDGFNGTWSIAIPYKAIDAPKGTTEYYLIPVLLIDDKGKAFGDRVKFTVTR